MATKDGFSIILQKPLLKEYFPETMRRAVVWRFTWQGG